MSRIRVAATAAVLALGVATAVQAQDAAVEIGRFFEGDDWTVVRAGIEHPVLGPLSVAMYGTHLRASGQLGERLWGAGVDLALFREARQGAYALGGLAGGFATDAARDFWGSWSVGAGYQVLPASFLSVAAEARWRRLTPGGRDGPELSFRVGAVFGGRARTPAEPKIPEPSPVGEARPDTRPIPLSTAGRLGTAATLADSVVAAAAANMGTAYRLGGTTTEGFDCSGLIQYAYGRYGISLPRTSREQAEAGEKVDRSIDALEPGDILTFSTQGGPVTHVGLYVGGGRFIHSASRGVQLSLLSPDDPYGRWWHKRWVGARRIVRGEK